MNVLVKRDDILLNTVVFLPSTYEPGNGSWPVLCFLHGSNECAPMDILPALTLHGPLRPKSSSLATNDFIVVAPQLPSPGGDVWHKHAMAVQQIVKAVWAEYRGDPERSYLTGFSYGAHGVFAIASVQPNFWAALWPVDPKFVPGGKPQDPVSLCCGEYARGDSWDKFIRDNENSNADFLHIDRGNDHVEAARMAYQDDKVYAWLKTKKRQ